MKVLILDSRDTELIQEALKKIVSSANVFTAGSLNEAAGILKRHRMDVVISDSEVSDGKTIEFLAALKEKQSKLNVIILSDSADYKAEALDMKVSGYLMKPLDLKALKKEMNDLRYPVKDSGALLRIQCFGNFSVFTSEGDTVHFSRTKEKELLAYLVYKHGSAVSTRELGAILFEDDAYDSKQQSYLQQLFHALSKDLRAISAEEVLIRDYNSTSIDVSKVDCDYYRFGNNEAIAKRLYTGEFMVQYEWADYVAGYLDRKA